MSIVTLRSLHYAWPDHPDPTLSIPEFDLADGENVFVKGPSGCGKSTFLSAIAGTIDVRPGAVTVSGTDVGALRMSARDRFRVDHLGVIFQIFNLIPWLSAHENVTLPCRFSERRRTRAGPDASATADRLLTELGLEANHMRDARAAELSIGQQQRVAAARALIGAPELVLADEPTSALDDDAKAAFIELLLRECQSSGSGLIFVSHDHRLERHFDRVVDFADLNQSECAP